MNTRDWMLAVADSVRALSDREYQQRTWLGHDPLHTSDPIEMCCNLCDDLGFADLLTTPEVELAQEQREAAEELLAAIDACVIAERLPPEQVLDHPEWLRVRLAAQRLYPLLSR